MFFKPQRLNINSSDSFKKIGKILSSEENSATKKQLLLKKISMKLLETILDKMSTLSKPQNFF